MTTAPIDRLTEIDQLRLHVDHDLSAPSLPDLLDEVDALCAALVDAEARAASAAQEARAVALREAEDTVRTWLYKCPTHESLADVLLGLRGTTPAKALERVQTEERAKGMERAGTILLDNPHSTRWHVLEVIRAEAAAIRARGET